MAATTPFAAGNLAADGLAVDAPRASRRASQDGLFPDGLDPDEEAKLIELVLSGNRNCADWLMHGPRFFMAGMAVLLAGLPQFEHQPLLELAEEIQPQSSDASLFRLWTQRCPLDRERFLARLERERRMQA